MKRSVAIFLALFMLGGMFVIATAVMVLRLTPENRRRQALWSLLASAISGNNHVTIDARSAKYYFIVRRRECAS